MPLFLAVDYALPDTSLSLRAPFKIILAVAAASASYYGIERRFLKLKQRFAPRARPGGAADSIHAQA
jgi:peptidoglycan/LPS O-acetylase OafA/YrhL